LVNNKKINIPSYQVKLDEVVSLGEKAQKNVQVLKLLEEKDKIIVPFLKRQGLLGKLIRMPRKTMFRFLLTYN
jgi:small subunit ribosomal protein S4